jgi:hypothetical protein
VIREYSIIHGVIEHSARRLPSGNLALHVPITPQRLHSFDLRGVNPMNKWGLAIQSGAETPENWAKWCQFSGHFLAWNTAGRRQNRASHPGSRTLRTLWILLCLLGLPAMARAQTSQSSWENLGTLHAGQKIQVAVLKSKTVSGSFVSVSDTAISLQTRDGEQTIQRPNVRNVKLLENKHRLRNAAIGGAVGAGVGAGIGAATYQSCKPAQSFCINPIGRGGQAGIAAVVGFAGGALVGALWPSHKTIYRSTNQ